MRAAPAFDEPQHLAVMVVGVILAKDQPLMGMEGERFGALHQGRHQRLVQRTQGDFIER